MLTDGVNPQGSSLALNQTTLHKFLETADISIVKRNFIYYLQIDLHLF